MIVEAALLEEFDSKKKKMTVYHCDEAVPFRSVAKVVYSI